MHEKILGSKYAAFVKNTWKMIVNIIKLIANNF